MRGVLYLLDFVLYQSNNKDINYLKKMAYNTCSCCTSLQKNL